MKTILVIFAFALVVSASTVEEDFVAWMHKYHKKFTPTETISKFITYQQNLERIAQLNAVGKGIVTFGVNQFADLSKEEFISQYLNTKFAFVPGEHMYPNTVDLPDSLDWREKGAVTPVKNQGGCGSCWAFSVTGNVEGQWFLAGHPLTSLSEQNLVDCDHECMVYQHQNSCDAGCGGGLMPNAYSYIIKNKGIASEHDYPYKGYNGQCRYNPSMSAANITHWTYIADSGKDKAANEDQIAQWIVDHGPVSIGVNAEEWQFYIGGVFYLPCLKSLDHGVSIVGFGHQKIVDFQDMKYWLVKNSWGSWGEKGYIKLERGNDKCGCSRFVTSGLV